MEGVYKLKYLTGCKLRTFLSVAARIIPADGEDRGAGTMITAGVADRAMETLDPRLRSQLLLLLILLEVAGIFFGGKPFSKSNGQARDRLLRWMENAPLGLFRTGFFGLKSYVCMGYYTREDVWKTIDYEGPLVPERPYADPLIRALCRDRIRVLE